jgi:hypothetical protein
MNNARIGNTLTIIGGVLAGISFFLPFFSITFFGFAYNQSLFSLGLKTSEQQIFYILPPFAALLMTGFALVTIATDDFWFRVVPIVFGIAGLGLTAFALYALGLQMANGDETHLHFDELVNYLGFGFWGNLLGFLLGILGGIVDVLR